jgi:hypothetical protein
MWYLKISTGCLTTIKWIIAFREEVREVAEGCIPDPKHIPRRIA